MRNSNNLYLGKSGQFAIMAEFLARGWNTCTPDVDVGDDVLVLEDRAGQFKRVQVKTASATPKSKGYSALFNISLAQLGKSISPEIHYVFMVRHKDKWANMLIINRDTLNDLYESLNIGSVSKDKNLMIHISFEGKTVTCSNVDFSSFIDNFSEFPPIEH